MAFNVFQLWTVGYLCIVLYRASGKYRLLNITLIGRERTLLYKLCLKWRKKEKRNGYITLIIQPNVKRDSSFSILVRKICQWLDWPSTDWEIAGVSSQGWLGSPLSVSESPSCWPTVSWDQLLQWMIQHYSNSATHLERLQAALIRKQGQLHWAALLPFDS